MIILRSSITHPSPISCRNIFFSAVANNNLNDSNINSANFAWKYWRRGNDDYSACWNQLRPYHQYTAGLQNRDLDENGTHTNYCLKYSGFSPKAFKSPSSLLSMQPPSHMTFMPTLLKANQMKTPVRCTSSEVARSKVEFSTLGAMPHSTSANSNKEQKQKQKEDTELASLPASQRARILFKKYGTVFVGTYIGVYLTTLFTLFVTLDFGLLDPETLSQIFKVSKNMACETADIIGPTGTGVSMNEAADAYAVEVKTEISKDKRTLVDIITGYLQNWDWTTKYAEKLSENPHLANLAVAWFMVKLTEPVRLAAAIIVTPKVAKALGREEAKVGAEEKS